MLSGSVLIAVAFFAGAGATPSIYEVKEGDSLAVIASQHNISTDRLLVANPEINPERLQIGDEIVIPASGSRPSRAIGTYKVREGDNDVRIAQRYDISASRLRELNPQVNWRRLQIGQELQVPGAGGTRAPVTTSATSAAPIVEDEAPEETPSQPERPKVNLLAAARQVATSPMMIPMESIEDLVAMVAPEPEPAPDETAAPDAVLKHEVKQGENDWVIAEKYNLRPSALHEANPGIDWRRLKPGQELVIPARNGAGTTNANRSNAREITTSHAKIRVANARVRNGGNTQRDVVVSVPQNTVARVRDYLNGWYKLEFERGTVGWVRGDLLSPVSANEMAQLRSQQPPVSNASTRVARIPEPSKNVKLPSNVYAGSLVATAMREMGVRYKWGGNSRSSGYDCSGFVKYVFKRHGVNLPRTSRTQATVGVAVPRNQLAVGDMVFFTNSRGSRIGHVGIYIGDNRFIHASSGGGKVEIDSLGQSYYATRYAGARRVKVKGLAQPDVTPEPVAQTPANRSETTTAPPDIETGTIPEEVPPLRDANEVIEEATSGEEVEEFVRPSRSQMGADAVTR
ncbi:MAG: NlpC/P60 family protein [Fimbriimonadaceae bacterium]